MPTVLVTLGRLPKALDLIRSFHAIGWRVIVADPFSNHIARSSRATAKVVCVPAPYFEPERYRYALLDIVAREKVDLVLPVSEDILYVSDLHETVPDTVTVLSMPANIVRQMHDKYEFTMVARDLNLAVPETALMSHQQAREIARLGPYIIKPRHSCAGFGVSRCQAGQPIHDQAGAIIQRAIAGYEVSTCALAYQGRVLGNVIYRASLLSGTVAIGFERIENQAVDKWVRSYVAATCWNGFISFDFIVDHEEIPHAIECNPRTTSGLHFFDTEDLAPAILDATAPLRFRRQRRLMQFWSVMQHFYDHIGRLNEMRRALRHIVATRDVTFKMSDPLPLLLMPWAAQEIMQKAKRDRVSFGIAATRDLAFPPEKMG